MSLQVWLPLNGDLHNQGLSDLTATNNGATVNDSGKIGKCYSFNGSQYITLPTSILSNFINEISVCAWVNITAWNSSYDSIIKMYAGSNAWNNSIFAMGRNGTTSRLYFSIANGSSSTQGSCTLTTDQATNTWYHIACVYNYTDKNMKIYLNGELKTTYATTIIPNFSNVTSIGIGGSPLASYGLKGKLNDVRIYNHALSPKEVEELSKGLILHYKLTYSQIGVKTNILTSARSLPTSGWSRWINSGGTNSTLAYSTDYDGNKIVTATGQRQTAGNALGPYVNLSGDSYFQWGKAYTFSCYVRATDNQYQGKTINFSIWNNNNQLLKTVGNGPITLTQDWTRYEGTAFFKDTNPGSSTINLYVGLSIPSISSGTGETISFQCTKFMLEEGIGATPWIEGGTSSQAYPAWDCSGYGYNGIAVGTLTTAEDSARYNYSTYTASGDTNYIQTPTLYFPGDQITMNFWFKSSNQTPGSDYHIPLDAAANSNQAYEMSIYKTGYLRGGLVVSGTRKVDNCTSTKLTDGSWHMCTMTYDGSTIRRYVDAVMEKSTTVTGTLVTSTYFALGHYGSNTAYCSKEAYTSDVRIYTTALSDSQILELYNTSATIDNTGNIYARELVEK